MRHSGGNQEALSLGQNNFFIAHGEVCRPVQNLSCKLDTLVGPSRFFMTGFREKGPLQTRERTLAFSIHMVLTYGVSVLNS